ncbi:shikimate kinase [Nocardia terpenica]|nr:shikimate kinase [Nocardia terpenica]MBF6102761.1 shikimate kinase [Nocardia terpenica]MBF6111048.1 shikimate kinase [Nocardia terpenica]MBF6117179.1 shikimate kinase [Nocardia terpenica]MBF6150980.1 shikimate kinase [Nocardia terpenica]
MIVPTDPRPPCVVLVGPPGAGKSTIGRKLAKELGVELFDTDAGIEEETGRTIPEIFAADGEPEFRRIEEQVVRRAILAERGVVSLGGGAVLSEATRDLLRGRTVVYLEISVAEGLRRTGAATHRPLLIGDDPAAKYRELMRRRRPLYREVASVRVRTDGRSPGRVVRNILARLGLEPTEPRPEPQTPQRPEGEGTSRRARARRRRRRRGKGADNGVAEANPPTSSGADGAGTDDGGEAAPKRRSRRSRRGGRRRPRSAVAGVDTAVSGPASLADDAGDQQDSTDAKSSQPGTGRPASNGDAPTRSSRRSRRRRAAVRAAGAPGAGAVVTASDGAAQSDSRTEGTDGRARRTASRPAGPPVAAPATTTAGSPATGRHPDSNPTSPPAQPDSPGEPAPGTGRSRRARARRARTLRAREESEQIT